VVTNFVASALLVGMFKVVGSFETVEKATVAVDTSGTVKAAAKVDTLVLAASWIDADLATESKRVVDAPESDRAAEVASSATFKAAEAVVSLYV
jgi:hypothetical protein